MDRQRAPTLNVCGELPVQLLGYHRPAMTLVDRPHPERFTAVQLPAAKREDFAQLFRQRVDDHHSAAERRDCAEFLN